MSTKHQKIVVACPDRDTEALGLAFYHQGCTFINTYRQAMKNYRD